MSNPSSFQQPENSPGAAYAYSHLDVFAERPLEGNQLAVFHDATGLSDAQMQAIARETNLSETTFVLPRAPEIERERGVRVRIFTRVEELPFAGHPTLGTASCLYWNHPVLRGADEIVLDLNVGPIPVRFAPPAQGVPGVFGRMRQNDPVFGEPLSHTEAAAAFGLAPGDLDEALPVQTVSTGNPFCIVPLSSLEVAERMTAANVASASLFCRQAGARFPYFVTRTATGAADWHARMFFHGSEDPATGSAAGPAVAWMVRHGAEKSESEIVIEQGVEMLRPSRLYGSATWDGAKVTKVFLGGRTIPVAMGRLFLP